MSRSLQCLVLVAVLATCALCSGCRWGPPLFLARDELPDAAPREEVTAPPPGQSTERRDPPALITPEA